MPEIKQAKMMRASAPLLGAHMSIAGGAYKACELGRSIGCDAIQIFTKAPSQWEGKFFSEEDGALFKKARKENRIVEVVAHNSYLINLASPDDSLWEKSIKAFAGEMERCRVLGVKQIVAHPGAHQKQGIEWGIERIAAGLDELFSSLPEENKVKVLLETTAGMGSSVGHTFEQLAGIRKLSKTKRRIGYCLDTAHILAAGYEFREKESYENMLKQFDKTCGLKNLRAIHLNDSKRDLNTKVDRHERVGKGFIGVEAMARFCADERLSGVPKLLEVPGGMEAFAEDLKLLRKWAGKIVMSDEL